MKKNEENLREIWDKIEHTNMCIMEVSGRGERKRRKKIFGKIIAENLLDLLKTSSKLNIIPVEYTQRDP